MERRLESDFIDVILKEIKEDKKDNPTTTSFKFKRDFWNFFLDKSKKVCVEFGTHKGQTTKIMSYLFDKVYTVNINDNKTARALNEDRQNITYISNFDLYSSNLLPIEDKIDVVLIDANHEYNSVLMDIDRITKMNTSEECFIVFDDYGLDKFKSKVRKAVLDAIDNNVLEVVQYIGHEPAHNFVHDTLTDYEGVITRLVRNK